jgi:hypothetical protein
MEIDHAHSCHILDADTGNLNASWQRMLHEDDRVSRTEGSGTIALSAFSLSAMKTPLERKQLVKEMWESGADIIVSARSPYICIRSLMIPRHRYL